uniref:Mediator of RNA polymerase II transcription subunit 31 n=1 Tax=Gongylonema pulchrum TaxID=637853 RepID=A0A183F1Q0_9BILA
LEALQSPHFREAIACTANAKFIEDQQLLQWQYYTRKRQRLHGPYFVNYLKYLLYWKRPEYAKFFFQQYTTAEDDDEQQQQQQQEKKPPTSAAP